MAEFACVDDRGRLWSVRDLLSPEQCEDILQVDWLNMPWNRAPQQAHWRRRTIAWDHPVSQRLSTVINSYLPQINHALHTDFSRAFGNFWLDEPGFDVAMHTDGHLPAVMQLYWHQPGTDYGTGFYRYRTRSSLLHQFRSEPNTGYIMLNHLDDDGSQPLQWHGMFNPVPLNMYRVSSYWYFE
jgi:hypothetical protein